ncbi:sulfotransferase [Neptuniibacter sp. PT8_73]|uniref:sulfotransferase n=1 Tax=unclassified Neptuniibacter TaxID=2630693 RepID=UPI0039F69CDB
MSEGLKNIDAYKQKAVLETLSRKSFNKLFCIGYNKTGTTSLEHILKLLGYKMPNQMEQEIRLVRQVYAGNFKPLIDFCGNFDAFQDMPFSQGVLYAQLDCLFPNSKFILTVRDSDEWFDSLIRFQTKGVLKRAGVTDIDQVKEEDFKDKNLYLYKNYTYENMKRHVTVVEHGNLKSDFSLLYDKQHRISIYEERNQQIIKYFSGRPNDLLVVDLAKENDIEKILSFLGLPLDLNIPVPKLNATK